MVCTCLVLFLVNWAINILLIEFMALRKLKNIINVDEERDSKYHAFRRLDVQWFSRPWLYMTCHLALIKFLLTFGAIFFHSFLSFVIFIGAK